MEKREKSTMIDIYENVDQWESGALGESKENARLSKVDLNKLRDAAELQLISIRMPKELVQDLKDLAKLNGLGYQPLIKQILKRFVDAEKKMMVREYMKQKLDEKDAEVKSLGQSNSKKCG